MVFIRKMMALLRRRLFLYLCIFLVAAVLIHNHFINHIDRQTNVESQTHYLGWLKKPVSQIDTFTMESTRNVQSNEFLPSGTEISRSFYPFEERKPKFLHLISYQRSGSTFIGDIFHNTPGVFYIYEPLDALYSGMYGTPDGWNVPSDIFFDSQGNFRSISQDEINSVKWNMETIFNCRMSRWPPALLLHKFLRSSIFTKRMNKISGYGKCLTANKVPTTTECQQPIRNICGKRLNPGRPEAELCRDIIWNNWAWNSTMEEINDRLRYENGELISDINRRKVEQSIPSKDDKKKRGKEMTYAELGIENAFQKYFSCLDRKWAKAKKCAVEHLESPCRNSSMRVIKTVRASMASDQDLLLKYKNYRVIHLVRDPRGAARSRSRVSWSQGLHERKNITREAISYCRSVLGNHQIYKENEILTRSTAKATAVVYDNIVANPIDRIKEVFRFMDFPVPSQTLDWLKTNTVNVKTSHKEKGEIMKEVRNSIAIASAWRDFYTRDELEVIWNGCKDFFDQFPSEWDRGY